MKTNRFIYLFLAFWGLMLVSKEGFALDWLAWSELDEKSGAIHVYLSKEVDSILVGEVQFTARGTNVTPSVHYSESSGVWVFWVDRQSSSSYALHFANIDPDTLSTRDSGIIPTKASRIYSPAGGFVDPDTPVVAWASFDGEDEEVKMSIRHSAVWSDEIQITDNRSPDSRPKFGYDSNGRFYLSWRTLNSSENVIQGERLTRVLRAAGYQAGKGRSSGEPNIFFTQRNVSRRLQTETEDFTPGPGSSRWSDNSFLMGSRLTVHQNSRSGGTEQGALSSQADGQRDRGTPARARETRQQ